MNVPDSKSQNGLENFSRLLYITIMPCLACTTYYFTLCSAGKVSNIALHETKNTCSEQKSIYAILQPEYEIGFPDVHLLHSRTPHMTRPGHP